MRLTELLGPGEDSLVVYSFMFPRDPGDDRPGPTEGETARLPLTDGPCPSCTALLDQLDGAVEHARQWINFVVVAKAPLPRLLAVARERGWRRLRLLSFGSEQLQPRLPRRDRRGAPATDAQRLPPRG